MIRVCPHSDSACKHGMACTFSCATDRYDGTKRPPTDQPDAVVVPLSPCPFCGGKAEIERFGNTRVSTIYVCEDCGCRLETGEEFRHGRLWNRRAAPPSDLAAENARLTDALAKAGEFQERFRAENERLREALEPFSAFGDFLAIETEGFADADTLDLVIEDHLLQQFRVSAFLRARQALSTEPNNGE